MPSSTHRTVRIVSLSADCCSSGASRVPICVSHRKSWRTRQNLLVSHGVRSSTPIAGIHKRPCRSSKLQPKIPPWIDERLGSARALGTGGAAMDAVVVPKMPPCTDERFGSDRAAVGGFVNGSEASFLKPATCSFTTFTPARASRAMGALFSASALLPNRPPLMLLFVIESRGVIGRAPGSPKMPPSIDE